MINHRLINTFNNTYRRKKHKYINCFEICNTEVINSISKFSMKNGTGQDKTLPISVKVGLQFAATLENQREKNVVSGCVDVTEPSCNIETAEYPNDKKHEVFNRKNMQ